MLVRHLGDRISRNRGDVEVPGGTGVPGFVRRYKRPGQDAVVARMRFMDAAGCKVDWGGVTLSLTSGGSKLRDRAMPGCKRCCRAILLC